ncbi:MAG: endopeptidase La, partial [Burkholderiaceae bacterium]|nr:endopeptidase La [Burkholderiaceae bacterium]
QFKANGLKEGELEITDEAITDIIRYYTREAGVRGLEREISKICRKSVKNALMAKPKATRGKKAEKVATLVIDSTNIATYLGVKKFSFGVAQKEPMIGQVNGLAWTEVGGDLLSIEAAVFPGKGQVQRTGSLGDVMKESVEAARSVVRARAESFGLATDIFGKTDWHLHFPEGATPKDGPSAGGAITTAMVSALTKIPVRSDVAMTGEITLHGEILEIGGLKEKLLAALRAGIKTVLIPKDNVKDLEEIPANVKNGLEIVPVKWIDEILPIALVSDPMKRNEIKVGDVTSELVAPKIETADIASQN